MTEPQHSPEAIARFPDGIDDHYGRVEDRRIGFEAGRESRLTVSREALLEFISNQQYCGSCASAPPYCGSCQEDVDTLLAAGIIRDEREVKAEAVEDYANALADNKSAVIWDQDTFVSDAREWATEIRRGP